MNKVKGQVKTIVSLIGLLILSSAMAWWFYQNKQVVQVPIEQVEEEVMPSPVPTIDPYEDWQTYTSEDGCFSFKYPSQVEFKMQGDLAHLSIWGPTQRENTEFYDGLSLGFLPIGDINISLSEYVDGKIEESKQTGEILQNKTDVIVNGISGLTYTASGMGTFKNTYLQSVDGLCGVEIGNITIDPSNQGYEKMVDEILATFTF